jgi:hypothetical protein
MAYKITLRTGDKATRRAMQRAHDDGRHGDPTSVPDDVLAHWAECCADCYWFAFYTEREAAAEARRVPGSNRPAAFIFARAV